MKVRVSKAAHRRSYGNGKQLCAGDPGVPPFLTFLGSQRFGYVVAEPPEHLAVESDGDVAGSEDDGEPKHQRHEDCKTEAKCSDA